MSHLIPGSKSGTIAIAYKRIGRLRLFIDILVVVQILSHSQTAQGIALQMSRTRFDHFAPNAREQAKAGRPACGRCNRWIATLSRIYATHFNVAQFNDIVSGVTLPHVLDEIISHVVFEGDLDKIAGFVKLAEKWDLMGLIAKVDEQGFYLMIKRFLESVTSRLEAHRTEK